MTTSGHRPSDRRDCVRPDAHVSGSRRPRRPAPVASTGATRVKSSPDSHPRTKGRRTLGQDRSATGDARGPDASPEDGPRHSSDVSKGGFGVELTFPAQAPETPTIGTRLRLDDDNETSRTS